MGDIHEPWMDAVQQNLQPLIKAPKLTDKLLKKPPFRFLHDVVTATYKATGFPKGYFTDDELDSSKVADKTAKIDFLAKVIKVIEAGTGEPCSAKPQVIVTGAEPENTGELLAKLASCAKLGDGEKEAAVDKALGRSAPAAEPPAAEEKPREKTPPPEKPREKTPPVEKAPEEKPKREKPAKEEPPAQSNVPAVAPIVPSQQDGARPGTATARKPPPKHESNEVTAEQAKNAAAAGVILESKGDEDKKEDRDWQAVVDEEEQLAQRARDAETKGEAKGYLGRQAQDAMREQEQKKEEEKRQAEAEGRNTQGIVLSTKRRGEKASSSGGMGESEMTKLREQLQLLTKATNPLGKFLEAIHEDIDTMSRELEMWRTEARTQSTAAQEAQRQTEQSLHEVHGKLQGLEDQIGDQMTKINLMRKQILDNDKTVETLLKMVVNPDVGGKKR